MFIKQVKHIGSVGRFRSCGAQGDVTFKRYTLVFGENGRGKTTFCAILRSLQTDNPEIIAGRKTLGSGGEPNVVLMLEGGNALFSKGKWNSAQPHLRIFDAQYVADNVYLGDAIGTDQRRNLCKLMLGEEGIAHRKAYDDADDAITEKTTALRSCRVTLSTRVRNQDVEQFLTLAPDKDIDTKIKEKRREVEGLRAIDNLKSRPVPEIIEMPPIPAHLSDILDQTLESVSREADQEVRKHLDAHGMKGNQDWIAEGLPHTRDDCPFCGQSVKGLGLIASYQAYFNEAYIKFRDDLTRYSRLPRTHYSDDRVKLLVQKVAANQTVIDLWMRYVAFIGPESERLGNVRDIIVRFREEMLAVLEKKRADPLVAVPLPPSYLSAYAAMEQLAAAVEAYNSQIESANGAIAKFKDAASPARLQSSENELRWFELTKARHEEPLKSAAEQYARLIAERGALEKVKQDARTKLDTYSTEVVKRHLKVINNHLDNFHAGFSLIDLEVGYTGREPNSTFSIVINRTKVAMGNSRTPLSEASFKNTLSGGDRITLALAFFLAQVADEREKAQCSVIFDDPFSSQDRHRRTYTINQIARCGAEVSQIVVLSHDNFFLREMWDRPLPKEHRKSLMLTPCGVEDTLLVEWDIEKDSEGEDAANKRVLAAFYQGEGGDPRDVVKRIRPVVETHMTRLEPELGKAKNLGDKLAKVRTDNAPDSLVKQYDLIDDLNTFTRKYMHGESKNPDAEHLSTSELKGWVKKTLELTGSL